MKTLTKYEMDVRMDMLLETIINHEVKDRNCVSLNEYKSVASIFAYCIKDTKLESKIINCDELDGAPIDIIKGSIVDDFRSEHFNTSFSEEDVQSVVSALNKYYDLAKNAEKREAALKAEELRMKKDPSKKDSEVESTEEEETKSLLDMLGIVNELKGSANDPKKALGELKKLSNKMKSINIISDYAKYLDGFISEVEQQEQVVEDTKDAKEEETNKIDISKLGDINNPSFEGFVELMRESGRRMTNEERDILFDIFSQSLVETEGKDVMDAFEKVLNTEIARKDIVDKLHEKVYLPNAFMVSNENNRKHLEIMFNQCLHKVGLHMSVKVSNPYFEQYKTNILAGKDMLESFREIEQSVKQNKACTIKRAQYKDEELVKVMEQEETKKEDKQEEVKEEVKTEKEIKIGDLGNDESISIDIEGMMNKQKEEIKDGNKKIVYPRFTGDALNGWIQFFYTELKEDPTKKEMLTYIKEKINKYKAIINDEASRSSVALNNNKEAINKLFANIKLNLLSDKELVDAQIVEELINKVNAEVINKTQINKTQLANVIASFNSFENIFLGLM